MNELQKRLEKLERDKVKEEGKLEEVMVSLRTETAGLQQEKDAKEQELLGMQKELNDTKATVSIKTGTALSCRKNLTDKKEKPQEK